LAYIGVIEGTV